jgi:hypothetical protein
LSDVREVDLTPSIPLSEFGEVEASAVSRGEVNLKLIDQAT